MKKLIFKKGIQRIIFPFSIHDFSPWQQQVAVEMEKVRSSYAPRKTVDWGFKIQSTDFAEIIVSKK